MHMAMVLTTLGSGGASHRSLSRYVASLLAAKSRSSRHAQIASLIARSSLFAYANNSFRSSVCWPISSGLWPLATLMSWNLHPLRSTLIDVCLHKHQWRRSVPGFQLNSVCLINNQCMEMYPRTPTAKVPSQNSNEKFQRGIPTKNSIKKFQHIGKWSRTPMFYTTSIMQYNLKSICIRYIPNVVQLKFSLHLTLMHMSLFSDKLIVFQSYQFKETKHFETTE